MDKRIRRNELCIIGLPRCDFVFSSARTCFIGYGFKESTLEMNVLRHLLRQRGVEPIEAGGTLAPGQNAFCTKICSKIIVSQFCIALVNNDLNDGVEMPNANVNMEYGLMFGFNKYVVPFQREGQTLPFNVAGLDMVKYTNESFERKATEAIDVAIVATTQEAAPSFSPDQILEAFLLSERLLIVPITTEHADDLRWDALCVLRQLYGFEAGGRIVAASHLRGYHPRTDRLSAPASENGRDFHGSTDIGCFANIPPATADDVARHER